MVAAVAQAAETATDAAALRSAVAAGDLSASARAAMHLAESAAALRSEQAALSLLPELDRLEQLQDWRLGRCFQLQPLRPTH